MREANVERVALGVHGQQGVGEPIRPATDRPALAVIVGRSMTSVMQQAAGVDAAALARLGSAALAIIIATTGRAKGTTA